MPVEKLIPFKATLYVHVLIKQLHLLVVKVLAHLHVLVLQVEAHVRSHPSPVKPAPLAMQPLLVAARGLDVKQLDGARADHAWLAVQEPFAHERQGHFQFGGALGYKGVLELSHFASDGGEGRGALGRLG